MKIAIGAIVDDLGHATLAFDQIVRAPGTGRRAQAGVVAKVGIVCRQAIDIDTGQAVGPVPGVRPGARAIRTLDAVAIGVIQQRDRINTRISALNSAERAKGIGTPEGIRYSRAPAVAPLQRLVRIQPLQFQARL